MTAAERLIRRDAQGYARQSPSEPFRDCRRRPRMSESQGSSAHPAPIRLPYGMSFPADPPGFHRVSDFRLSLFHTVSHSLLKTHVDNCAFPQPVDNRVENSRQTRRFSTLSAAFSPQKGGKPHRNPFPALGKNRCGFHSLPPLCRRLSTGRFRKLSEKAWEKSGGRSGFPQTRPVSGGVENFRKTSRSAAIPEKAGKRNDLKQIFRGSADGKTASL